jgi:hypothetical protein
MPTSSADDDLKLTRRRFMQYAAATSAATAGVAAIAMKTDAVDQQRPLVLTSNGIPGDGERYPYSNPP